MKFSTLLSIFLIILLLPVDSSFANSSGQEPAETVTKAEYFSQVEIGSMAPLTPIALCKDQHESEYIAADKTIDWNRETNFDSLGNQVSFFATAIRRFDGFDIAVHIPKGLEPTRSEKDFKQAVNAAIVFAFSSREPCEVGAPNIPVNGIGLEGHSFLTKSSGENTFLPFVSRKTK